MDMSLLERVNPVYNTAKMALGGLALSGDRDAVKIMERLGLPIETVKTDDADGLAAIQALANSVFLEIRFRTTGALAGEAGAQTIVDLPCGYTPRGLQFGRKGISYVGLDLPATIQDLQRIVMPLADENAPSAPRYAAVDATNYTSLERALSGITGPICVTTEGLVMYFNDSEAVALCDNIRRLLLKYSGCWITSDPEMMVQNGYVMRAVAGDRYQEVMQNLMRAFESKADIHVEVPALMIRPWEDIEADTKKAQAFLKAHGLRAERMIVGEHMPQIAGMAMLKPDVADAVKCGMQAYAYWKITPDQTDLPEKEERSAENFAVRTLLSDRHLTVTLTGRVDTLTAPQVLELFEKNAKEADLDSVTVDCKDLAYISSAGLRVLLIMHKACRQGVSITDANQTVTDILKQTGFDFMIKV